MHSSLYQVTISQLIGAGADGDGFIDNTKTVQYMANGSYPVTLNDSLSKEKANLRYLQMIASMQLMANIYISNAVAVGANANTAASSFTFIAEAERGDNAVVTADELNAGAYLQGNVAIQRAIARALTTSLDTDYAEIYDPTTSQAIGPGGTLLANVVRMGDRILYLNAGALANSISNATNAVTVTRIW